LSPCGLAGRLRGRPGFPRGPIEDKAAWRDPLVLDAYAGAALASDPAAVDRDPPAFRAPSGPLVDSYYLAIGRQFWDASLVTAPTLIVRGERDFWSRPEDAERLADHLDRVETLTIPDATHFVHLDRPARGRDVLVRRILAFLRATDGAARS
jgi:pimeloyl-ACP methyl ester carboxylesterase